LWLPHTETFLCDFNVLASFTVFVCFDFCTSDLRSSCCLRTSSLYDAFVLRSVDTLLLSIWGLHTMTSLSWLAIRAATVSLRSNAPKLDAVTKQVITRFGLSRRRGSRVGKPKHCYRAKVDDDIRGIPVVVGYRSTRYLEPAARFTKYLTTIVRLSYDNAEDTIDLRRTSNLQNVLRITQSFS